MASKEDVTGRKQGNKKCLHLLAYPFPCTQKGFEFCLELCLNFCVKINMDRE